VSLGHAALIPGHVLDTLCVSDKPILDAECGYFDEQDHVLLFGRFAHQGPVLRWAFPQVELRRVGEQRAVQLAMEGMIAPLDFNGNTLQIRLQFGDDSISGVVRFHPD
jgi:hypothetical protein